ncbi:PK beta-barrel-protein domain-containing protein-like protein [Xylariaceae sp. FL0804]|nr:PK beta-barrel-protein domain-containing protein-like protein [Xylariaceae sp. FL0804]
MGYPESESDAAIAPLPPPDTLLSLRTGKVRPLAGVKIKSAINKQPRDGRVLLSKFGFAGDERDYLPHQSADNAVHQYDPRHYDMWRAKLPEREHKFSIGSFGENISTAHLSEHNVCVGDKFRLGSEAVLQVTMSRQPCYKLNHRFGHKKMSSLAQSTGCTGWLYRVLQHGQVQVGDGMELIERINPRWPLSRLQHHLYTDRNNMAAMAEIIDLPGLGQEIVHLIQKRLSQGAEDMGDRLNGDVAVPWRSYKLVEKTPLTARAQRFVFAAEDGNITSEDGQFARFAHVRLKFGPESRFTRAYSVVSGDLKTFELGIARDDNSRGGSIYLHDSFHVGDAVEVAKGHASPIKVGTALQKNPKKHIFIIGGVGVTAFLKEIKALAQQSQSYEVHYAVRSREDAAYLSQLPPAATTVYAKAEGQRLDVAGIVPPSSDSADPDTVIYCCGPTSLLEACRSWTRKQGYPPSHVHFEEFGGAATGTGDPFEAEVKSTGQVLQVPGEKTLLQVLNEAGFDIDSSCLVGNCGSCMVDTCKGEVKHQGVALDEEQKESSMLSCVSRGKGRILIDC